MSLQSAPTLDERAAKGGAGRFVHAMLQRGRRILRVAGLGAVGWLLIGFCAANDIAQSEYTAGASFASNYFLCWVTMSTLVVSYPVYWAATAALRCWRWRHEEDEGEAERLVAPAAAAAMGAGRVRRLLRLGVLVVACAVLSFVSTWLWYWDLTMVPPSLNFALSHAELLMVAALSWLVLGRPLGWRRAAVLTLLTIGLALICVAKAWGPSAAATNTAAGTPTTAAGWWHLLRGVVVIFAATATWALYEVLYALLLQQAMAATAGKSLATVAALQSLTGAVVLVVGGALLPAVWALRVEPLPALASGGTWAFLAASSAFAATYFFAYPLALALTSPIEVSIGSLVSIPVSSLVDHLLWRTRFSWLSIAGMTVVVFCVLLDAATALLCKRSPPPAIAKSSSSSSPAGVEIAQSSRIAINDSP